MRKIVVCLALVSFFHLRSPSISMRLRHGKGLLLGVPTGFISLGRAIRSAQREKRKASRMDPSRKFSRRVGIPSPREK